MHVYVVFCGTAYVNVISKIFTSESMANQYCHEKNAQSRNKTDYWVEKYWAI